MPPFQGIVTSLTSLKYRGDGQSTAIPSDLQCLLEMWVEGTLNERWVRGPGISGHLALLLAWGFCREGFFTGRRTREPRDLVLSSHY